jgi:sulfatase maturation enzyme AslB (radical SAM superfamily)
LAAQQLYEEYHQDTRLDLPGPQGIDYSVGNLCNLKCVICGPQSSTAWIPDYQRLHPDASINELQYQKFNQIEIDNPEVLKNITSVHFHGGGEPLLSSSHVNLLKKIRAVKGLADVRVFYNTNGTQQAPQAVLDLWSECRLVELYFSIDDVGARFDYQRTGADWRTVQDNLTWYRNRMPHNHMFNINCVWSYLNFYSLPDLVDWYRTNFATNRYGDPTNLIFQRAIGSYTIQHLSSSTVQHLAQRFAGYPELLELLHSIPVNDEPHTEFWQEIGRIDAIRGNDFKQLCPEWSQLL